MTAEFGGVVVLALAYCLGLLTAHLIHWRQWRRLRAELDQHRARAIARGLVNALDEYRKGEGK